MAGLVAKQIEITEQRAKWLEQLARIRGMTESALIDEGLELLLRQHDDLSYQPDSSPGILQEDWEQLRRWESEFGSLQPSIPARQIEKTEIVSAVGTPVDPSRVRRIEEQR